MPSQASHLSKVIIPNMRRKAVVGILDALEDEEFDSVAVSGTSGLGIGSIIAYLKDVGLSVIRKSTANCHSGNKVETTEVVKRYIIVDDLVDSGKTLRRIVKGMRREHPDAICVGVYLYYNGRYFNESHPSIKYLNEKVIDTSCF